jgi:aminobenzoyl-glutamate utilization protein B
MTPAGLLAAKAAIDPLTEPALLKRAQDEFGERTGGGIDGTKWMAPLLPKDFSSPVDLRRREYVQTARGEEWRIRTPGSGQGAEICSNLTSATRSPARLPLLDPRALV